MKHIVSLVFMWRRPDILRVSLIKTTSCSDINWQESMSLISVWTGVNTTIYETLCFWKSFGHERKRQQTQLFTWEPFRHQQTNQHTKLIVWVFCPNTSGRVYEQSFLCLIFLINFSTQFSKYKSTKPKIIKALVLSTEWANEKPNNFKQDLQRGRELLISFTLPPHIFQFKEKSRKHTY